MSDKSGEVFEEVIVFGVISHEAAVEAEEAAVPIAGILYGIAGFLLGPECGLAVGTLGTFIYQMIMYGFSATTALWILPYSILGLVCGLYARKHNYDLSAKQYFVMTMLCEFMVTILNTGTIYIDSHIYGYYTPALIIGALGLRLLICFTKGAVFGGIMPKLISTVRRAVVQN